MSSLSLHSSLKLIENEQEQKFSAKNCIGIPELLLIQQQSELISEISKSYMNHKKNNTFSTDISELSFDIGQNPHNLHISMSQIQFGKDQSRFFEEESLEEALKEIRKHCSRKTYNFIRDKFRVTEDNRKEYKLEKQIKYNQQLMRRCLKLTHEVKELKEKLQVANITKVQEKKGPNKGQNLSIEKGQVFLKWQKSMIYKQKIHAETKKNINRLFSSLNEQKSENQNIRNQMEQILHQLQQFEESSFELKETIICLHQNILQQRKLSIVHEQDYKKTQNQIQSIIQELKMAIGAL